MGRSEFWLHFAGWWVGFFKAFPGEVQKILFKDFLKKVRKEFVDSCLLNVLNYLFKAVRFGTVVHSRFGTFGPGPKTCLRSLVWKRFCASGFLFWFRLLEKSLFVFL